MRRMVPPGGGLARPGPPARAAPGPLPPAHPACRALPCRCEAHASGNRRFERRSPACAGSGPKAGDLRPCALAPERRAGGPRGALAGPPRPPRHCPIGNRAGLPSAGPDVRGRLAPAPPGAEPALRAGASGRNIRAKMMEGGREAARAGLVRVRRGRWPRLTRAWRARDSLGRAAHGLRRACVTSNFTFLTGGSHPQEYALRAIELGLPAFAIADRNSVAGLVRAHQELREAARGGGAVPRLLPAARLCLAEGGPELTAVPRDRAGWGRLCRAAVAGGAPGGEGGVSAACRGFRRPRGDAAPACTFPPGGRSWPGCRGRGSRPAPSRGASGGEPALRRPGPGAARPGGAARGRARAAAGRLGGADHAPWLPPPAGGRADLHPRGAADRQPSAGRRRPTPSGGSGPRPRCCGSLRRATRRRCTCRRVARSAGSRSTSCATSIPREIWDGEDPQARLERLTGRGLAWRYPHGVPRRPRRRRATTGAIGRLNYAPYFLTVSDVVDFAPLPGHPLPGARLGGELGGLLRARGHLGPAEVGTMVFERFVSEARDEPPDIDVDFEHERREEVIQYIYRRFGRHRAGNCATVIHYRGKRAVREVGAAMGLSRDTVAALSSRSRAGPRGTPEAEASAQLGLDPGDRRLALTMSAWSRRSSASRGTSPSTWAGSSSPRGGSTSWCRWRTRRWRTARSSAGTRTTSTPWGSSRSTCWRSACSPASTRGST